MMVDSSDDGYFHGVLQLQKKITGKALPAIDRAHLVAYLKLDLAIQITQIQHKTVVEIASFLPRIYSAHWNRNLKKTFTRPWLPRSCLQTNTAPGV